MTIKDRLFLIGFAAAGLTAAVLVARVVHLMLIYG